MIKTALFLLAVLLFAVSCRRDEACECLAENIRVMKAYRLKGYAGNCEKTGEVCESFRGTSQADFRKFDKKTKSCVGYKELKKELRLMQDHFMKRRQQESEKMQEIIRKEMESLESKQ